MTFRESVSGKLVAYFKQRLNGYNYKHGWIKCDCPHCGKQEKFGVHVGKDRTHCFVCDVNLKPLDLILELEGFTTRREVYDFVRNLTDIDSFQAEVKPLEQKEVDLPESFKLLNLGTGYMAKYARDYIKSRGLDPIQMAFKGWGYCTDGEYAGCIIMPFFSQGKLQYFIGRRFVNMGEKFKNPEVEQFGIGKNQLMYNRDALLYYNRIQVVESVMNAETIGDTAVATLGKKISGYQLSEILRSPVEKVEILLDPDAYLDAIETGMKIATNKKVKVILLPGDKDVNDIGKKETKLLRDAVPWQSYQDLYKIKLFETNRLEYERNN